MCISLVPGESGHPGRTLTISRPTKDKARGHPPRSWPHTYLLSVWEAQAGLPPHRPASQHRHPTSGPGVLLRVLTLSNPEHTLFLCNFLAQFGHSEGPGCWSGILPACSPRWPHIWPPARRVKQGCTRYLIAQLANVFSYFINHHNCIKLVLVVVLVVVLHLFCR